MSALNPTLYCRDCSVWWTEHAPCWSCGQPGTDTAGHWELKPARSWVNPADWTADTANEDGSEL